MRSRPAKIIFLDRESSPAVHMLIEEAYASVKEGHEEMRDLKHSLRDWFRWRGNPPAFSLFCVVLYASRSLINHLVGNSL